MAKPSAPWFKCFPRDWLEGTRGLSAEQRGIYFDCLCLMYEMGGPLPLDDKWMSFQLHVSTRLWRSIKKALIAAGKIVETPAGLINVRAQVELDSRSNQLRTKREPATKIQKNPVVSTRARVRLKTTESESDSESAVAATKIDPHELYRRLAAAAGAALSPLAIGLQSVGEPISWIAQGADVDLDVVATVKALSARARPQSIGSWRYFSAAVEDARAKRTHGLPPASAAAAADAMAGRRPVYAYEIFQPMVEAAEAAKAAARNGGGAR